MLVVVVLQLEEANRSRLLGGEKRECKSTANNLYATNYSQLNYNVVCGEFSECVKYIYIFVLICFVGWLTYMCKYTRHTNMRYMIVILSSCS
jgi:hypothetical protein